MLGMISIEAMETVRQVTTKIIHSVIGSIVLALSLIIHFSIAMRALYNKPLLNLPLWQQLQLLSGIVMILLLIPHAVPIRGIHAGFKMDTSYPLILQHLWTDGLETIRQIGLTIVAWLHVCLGLHYWLKTKSWYFKNLYWIYGLAILWPTLSLIGFIQAGAEAFDYDVAKPDDPQISSIISTVENSLLWAVIWISVLVLFLKWYRRNFVRATKACTISIAGVQIKSAVGQSILNGLRFADFPHASICGGRARCTTCRVRVNQGMDHLQPKGELEKTALKRINAPPGVRLACQAELRGDVNVTALLPVDANMKLANPAGGISGEEREVVVMFVDLRESTKISEHKLPYDVLFLLNQFFIQMSEALIHTKGHYAQFAGDGLMALYGLDTDSRTACKQALAGAAEMIRRIDHLNMKLQSDLEKPLKIGIGLHFGDAIVGSMGPPKSPNFSAIGDTVNTAARLEAQTKPLNCLLVISKAFLMHCDADYSKLLNHTVSVHGRNTPMDVFCVDSIDVLEILIDSIDIALTEQSLLTHRTISK